MGNKNILIKNISLIILLVLSRLIPHPPNMVIFGAASLSAGFLGKNNTNMILILCSLFITDIFFGFHTTIPLVYGSYILIFLLGRYVKRKQNSSVLAVGSLAIVSSLIFFFITNWGSWLTMPMYPKTISGLFQAYIYGIPFFKNTLISDVIFSLGFYFVFYFQRRWSIKSAKIISFLHLNTSKKN